MKFKIINESIPLGKPFNKFTKKDLMNYLNLGEEDGLYFFINGEHVIPPTTGSYIQHVTDYINLLEKDGGLDDCVNFIKTLSFPLKVYRGLLLKNDDDLNLNNIGHHWTVNPNLFFGESGLRCCNDYEDITHVVIGKINNQDDIDLEATLALYADNSAGDYANNWDETEDEIYIPDTSKIQILSIMPFEDYKYSRMRRAK